MRSISVCREDNLLVQASYNAEAIEIFLTIYTIMHLVQMIAKCLLFRLKDSILRHIQILLRLCN